MSIALKSCHCKVNGMRHEQIAVARCIHIGVYQWHLNVQVAAGITDAASVLVKGCVLSMACCESRYPPKVEMLG